jgi:hypothetical protein
MAALNLEPLTFEPAKLEPLKCELPNWEPLNFQLIEFESSKYEPLKLDPPKFELLSLAQIKLEPLNYELPTFESIKCEPLNFEPQKFDVMDFIALPQANRWLVEALNDKAQVERRLDEVRTELDDHWAGICDPYLSPWFDCSVPSTECVPPVEYLQHWYVVDAIRTARLEQELDALLRLQGEITRFITDFVSPPQIYRRFSCLISDKEKSWRLMRGPRPPRLDAGVSLPAFAEAGGRDMQVP